MFEHFNVPVLGNPQLSALNKLTEVFFAVACAAIAVLALAAPRRPRLPQLCFLVLAAFLMTNKVWSPQYVVWLVPLALGQPLPTLPLGLRGAGCVPLELESSYSRAREDSGL